MSSSAATNEKFFNHSILPGMCRTAGGYRRLFGGKILDTTKAVVVFEHNLDIHPSTWGAPIYVAVYRNADKEFFVVRTNLEGEPVRMEIISDEAARDLMQQYGYYEQLAKYFGSDALDEAAWRSVHVAKSLVPRIEKAAALHNQSFDDYVMRALEFAVRADGQTTPLI